MDGDLLAASDSGGSEMMASPRKRARTAATNGDDGELASPSRPTGKGRGKGGRGRGRGRPPKSRSTRPAPSTDKKKRGAGEHDDAEMPDQKTTRKGSRQDAIKVCLCCPRKAKAKGRFCLEVHHPVFDAMRYAANLAPAPKGFQGKTQLDIFNEYMKDEETAKNEVLDYYAKNPVMKKYARRIPFDFGVLNKRILAARQVTEGSRLYPFEYKEFCIRQTTKYGRTEEEAEEMWKAAKRMGAKRDEDGYKGQLRLWLLKSEWKDNLKILQKSSELKQSTSQLKGLGAADLDEAEAWIHRSANLDDDEFFEGKTGGRASREKAKMDALRSDSDNEGKAGGDGAGKTGGSDSGDSEDDDDAKPKCNIVQKRTSAFSASSNQLKVLHAQCSELLAKIRESLDSSRDNPVADAESADAKARAVYVNLCRVRARLLCSWRGSGRMLAIEDGEAGEEDYERRPAGPAKGAGGAAEAPQQEASQQNAASTASPSKPEGGGQAAAGKQRDNDKSEGKSSKEQLHDDKADNTGAEQQLDDTASGDKVVKDELKVATAEDNVNQEQVAETKAKDVAAAAEAAKAAAGAPQDRGGHGRRAVHSGPLGWWA